MERKADQKIKNLSEELKQPSTAQVNKVGGVFLY